MLKNETQIALMSQLINKEDNKQSLVELKSENRDLKDALATVSEMFVVLANNINLEENAKKWNTRAKC